MEFPSNDQFKRALDLLRYFERRVNTIETEISLVDGSNHNELDRLQSQLTEAQAKVERYQNIFDHMRGQIDAVIERGQDMGVVFPSPLTLPRDLDIIRSFYNDAANATRNQMNPFDGFEIQRDEDQASRQG